MQGPPSIPTPPQPTNNIPSFSESQLNSLTQLLPQNMTREQMTQMLQQLPMGMAGINMMLKANKFKEFGEYLKESKDPELPNILKSLLDNISQYNPPQQKHILLQISLHSKFTEYQERAQFLLQSCPKKVKSKKSEARRRRKEKLRKHRMQTKSS